MAQLNYHAEKFVNLVSDFVVYALLINLVSVIYTLCNCFKYCRMTWNVKIIKAFPRRNDFF